jgi:hypothetical protein
MREDATSLEDVLQVNQGAPTVCKLASKGGKDQCASMKTEMKRLEVHAYKTLNLVAEIIMSKAHN